MVEDEFTSVRADELMIGDQAVGGRVTGVLHDDLQEVVTIKWSHTPRLYNYPAERLVRILKRV